MSSIQGVTATDDDSQTVEGAMSIVRVSGSADRFTLIEGQLLIVKNDNDRYNSILVGLEGPGETRLHQVLVESTFGERT